MDDLRDKILEFVKRSGPVLPVQISKVTNGNILFAGAVLSELVYAKKLIISTLKVGASPIYYAPEQRHKLVEYIKYLSEKPRKAAELLMDKKILRDSAIEPWQRVALREIKDFAIPLEVKIDDKTEIFWRWYLLSNEDAEKSINEMLNLKKEEEIKEEPPKEEVKEEVVEEIIPKKEVQEKIKVKREKKVSSGKGFYEELVEYLKDKDIKIVSESVLKKDKDFEFVVKLGSRVGELDYLIVAKNKKKVNEADLSLAFNRGHSKRLPVMFLSNGEATKNAAVYIEKELKGMIFRKI